MKKNSDFNFGLPPNRANIKITRPGITVNELNSQFLQAGLTSDDLPQNYDVRSNYNISPPHNQYQCGNCWAMSSTSVLNDRFIMAKNDDTINLTPILLTQCSSIGIDSGCGGGQPIVASDYFAKNGTYDTKDLLLNNQNCECLNISDYQNCLACGADGTSTCPTLTDCNTLVRYCVKKDAKPYKCLSGNYLYTTDNNGNIDPEKTIHSIKLEILKNGPVVGCFNVFNDFTASVKYKWDKTKSIYIYGQYNDVLKNLFPDKDMSALDGRHAVEIVGWGVEDDVTVDGKNTKVEYWIVKNSWGSNWMDGGYFKMGMYPFNTQCGLDIPVNMGDQFFGSAFAINIDKDSGYAPSPNPPPPPPLHDDSETKSEKKIDVKKIIIIICVVLGILILVYLIYKFLTSYRSSPKISVSSASEETDNLVS